MLDNDFITKEQAVAASKEALKLKRDSDTNKSHAEYVSEAVRQLVYAQYGAETYTKGLNVYTTIKHTDQTAAYNALRKGIMDFERRQSYRGPELFVDLPSNQAELEDAIDNVLTDHHNMDDLKVAVVTEMSWQKSECHDAKRRNDRNFRGRFEISLIRSFR